MFLNTISFLKNSKVILIILFFFYGLSIYAQFPQGTLDYNELIKNAKRDDSTILNVKLQLGYYFWQNRNLDSIRFYIKQVEKNKSQLNSKQLAVLYNLTGKYYLNSSLLDSSRIYFDKSAVIAKEIEYTRVLADDYNGKAISLLYQSNYEESMKSMLLCLEVLEITKDQPALAMNEYNLGSVFIYTKNYERAKHYIFKSLDRLEILNAPEAQFSMRYGSLCNIYLKEKNIDSATYCLSKMIDNGDEKFNNYNWFKGVIAIEKNQNKKAISRFTKSLKLIHDEQKKDKATRFNKIAQAYLNLKQADSSLLYLKIADTLYESNDFPVLKRSQDSLFYRTYELLGDTTNTLLYLKEYQTSVDHTLSPKKIQAAGTAETNYRIEKKQMVIEHKEGQLEKLLSKAQYFYVMIAILAFGFILFLIFSMRKQKRLRKTKVYIENEYKILLAKNVELKDTLYEVSKKLNKKRASDPSLRYKNSSLTEQQREAYMNSILAYMNTEKPYLDPDITQKNLSEQLQLSKHHLSEVINLNFGKNFQGLINLYRVEEAKHILENDTKNITMLAVAFDSGFKSKASFNRVFKEISGITPSAYKNKIVASVKI